MRNNGPETESSALRFGGIAQTIILSAVAAAICTLFKVHALTEAQASIALVTALPTVMTILVRRDTKE
ncbi:MULTISPECIES: hypothetical protein [Sphingobium]|uniref:Uncharacterized protein n=1 Tax=Sphingobium agri TaxID=2933566 RepID=A0ABT0E1R7_9SPHN|nr:MULTISPECIES: hypothetical protein [Sphingobium]MCK0533308.1 hypothetical protein [Sphingobium agri]QPI73306.1 hypothetical protein IZV00_01975 [Sphingobium sp. Cam5-1]